MISASKFILASLRQHGRIHAAVALAVAAATAVLTGALVVGDSVRGSLRHLALDRIGRIDEVIVADRFFRAKLADELKGEPAFEEQYDDALPAILLQGTIETAASEQKARASNVTVLGIDDMFWSLGDKVAPRPLTESQIILNEPLASELGAKEGEELILRIGQASQIPADSPLGRKTDSIRNRRLTVAEILPAEGLGRFGLRPNQQMPFNAFVASGTLQAMLDQPDKVNAIFIAGEPNREVEFDEQETQRLLRPTLGDLGFVVAETPQGYVNFTSTRMLLDPSAKDAARKALAGHRTQESLTYLANYIKAGTGKIPYSTVTAVDFQAEPPLGPFTNAAGETIPPLADDEIVLNRWTADDFAKQGVDLKPGDTITIDYFEPESTHGEVKEKSATFRLKAIAEMTPIAADHNFTPELPGVTDQKSITNWDPPFPYDDTRVRSRKPHDEDEAYWDEYKATPKAFVSLAAGRKLWSSRFGDTTAIRIVPSADEGHAAIERSLLKTIEPTKVGYQFLPIRSWALKASAGTTPFNLLFIGFSFFIVASAIMLIALLFRLGVEQRASEIGVLAAVGLRRRKVASLLLGEMLIVSIIGGLLGTVTGVGYAWLMLVGLKTIWIEAIRTPFLHLYLTPLSLMVGFVSGLIVSLLTTIWTLWRMRHIAVRRLLVGQATEDSGFTKQSSRWPARIGWTMVLLAIGIAMFAGRLRGEAQAGAFFGSGACALIAALLLINDRLRRPHSKSLIQPGRSAMLHLAMRNGARNPRRSVLTIGLVAAAAFLIVAISAFRLDPSAEGVGKMSGSGGFSLIAEASQPIYKDLNSEEGRSDLGFSRKENDALKDAKLFGLRVQPGDDASCLNLYQTAQPRAIGVPGSFIDRGGFAWAGSLTTTPEEKTNPWLLLDKSKADGVVPVVLDANTAMYSLHRGLGDTLDLIDGRSRPMKAQIVGLLKNSIFQGDLLMSQANFLDRFPDVNGYRMLVAETDLKDTAAVQSALETALGDYGLDAERSTDRLANFFAVQNTYLSTFQSLGGLGLLLGTFGLAAVQLRSVLERRGELALLRASGFRKKKLGQLVMLENGVLLIGGLLVGVTTALIAVLPHWLSGDASAPWRSLILTLLAVLVVGILAGTLAVRSALRAPLVAALRGD